VADLSFIDSSGISVLVLAHKQLAERGGQLVLRSPQRIVYRVLEVTGLTQVFRFD
jgi:anti-anti-sigma factor